MPTVTAAVWNGGGQPLQLEQLRLVDPGEGEVRVRLRASGVCHSDYHVVKGEWARRFPPVLGHEGAGVVEEVGPGVTHGRGRRPRRAVVEAVLRRLPAVPARPLRAVRGGDAHRQPDGRRPAAAVARRRGGGVDGRARHVRRADRGARDRASSRSTGRLPFEIAAIVGCAVTTGVGAVLNTARVEPGSTRAGDRLRRRRAVGHPRRPAGGGGADHRRRPGDGEARAGAAAGRDARASTRRRATCVGRCGA